jgi:hypothetical protein
MTRKIATNYQGDFAASLWAETRTKAGKMREKHNN